jgi:hypothetical protein
MKFPTLIYKYSTWLFNQRRISAIGAPTATNHGRIPGCQHRHDCGFFFHCISFYAAQHLDDFCTEHAVHISIDSSLQNF